MSPLNQNNPKSRRGLTPERYGIWGPLGPYKPAECTKAWLPALQVWPAIPIAGLASALGGAHETVATYPLSIIYGSKHYLLR